MRRTSHSGTLVLRTSARDFDEHNGTEAPCPMVLVVDDEPRVRAAMRRELSLAGYAVLEAGSVVHALTLLRALREDIRLVISEVGLPDGLWPTLLREARTLCPSMPTLLMSDDARLELVRRGSAQADARPFTNPKSGSELLDLVDSLLADDECPDPRRLAAD